MKKIKILPSVTTTGKTDWREKVDEVKKFKLKEIALFPTVLKMKERKELYKELENIVGLKIIHVHLCDDVTVKEIDYLVKKFNTKVFNIHPQDDRFGWKNYLRKYSKQIYVENTAIFPNVNELKKYGGLCLDFAHLEDLLLRKKLNKKEQLEIQSLMRDYPIGCSHLSAILSKKKKELYTKRHLFSSHFLYDLSEMDYLKKYQQFLPSIASIELENSIAEQLEVKKYLTKILNLLQ